MINKKNHSIKDIKSDFITIASHQLRTPIAAIRWSLDTLLGGKAGDLSEKQKSIIQEAYLNNKFLVKIINDLLRAARIEERGIIITPQLVNIASLVKDIIKSSTDFARACNCRIIFNLEKNLAEAHVDPLQIKPIIAGLIDNAIRYSQTKGKIEIHLKKFKNYLLLIIKDNGIGIPADQQNLVFSRFFRARNAIKAQTEGLGLDLYMAKKIIEASGGKIRFKSIENKGSTFYVYLPIIKKKLPAKKIDKQKSETQEAEAEDVLKKEREFVSITVHELKAPLGATKWSLEMLKGGKPGKLSKNQLELINQIYRGNERLLVLVRDLLDLAKLQEGKFDVKPQPINLETIIKDIATGFLPEAKRKKIKLELPKLKKLLPKIIGDSNRVAQVITNLISNAIKYTPENGQVTVRIQKLSGAELKKIEEKIATANILHTDNKKGYLVISVQDTGIGISEEEQKKLFTRFFRGQKVLKSKAGGTGLGLYITKTIVNLHRGDIWFTSQQGKGSTFYFSLPIA